MKPAAVEFAIDDQVRTPGGTVASVLVVYPDAGEVLVQWFNGDRARFKFSHLKLLTDKEKSE